MGSQRQLRHSSMRTTVFVAALLPLLFVASRAEAETEAEASRGYGGYVGYHRGHVYGGYGRGYHHLGKRSAEPNPEAEANPEPEAEASRPGYGYGHRSYGGYGHGYGYGHGI